MCAKLVQLCPTLCNPMDCSLPVSSVCGILQARVMEWVAMRSYRVSSWPRKQTWVSRIISSVQSLSRVQTLQPHESQHARPPCPSPTPGVHSDSRPSSQWCHPAISTSVVPFSSCPQSLSASESFPMSQHFAWAGQSTGNKGKWLKWALPQTYPGSYEHSIWYGSHIKISSRRHQ